MENTTAKVSCFARAYHYNNNTTHIFADSVAEQLLGNEYSQIADSMKQGISFFLPGFQGTEEEGLRLIADRQLSPSVLGRSAYCEKLLEKEKRIGCRQYIIFASGYDSFAIRNTDKTLPVFELDYPHMFKDKLQRIEKAGLSSGAVFVPCDLSEKQWPDKLEQCGFHKERKAFASMLGISYYLTKEEFKTMLKSLSAIYCHGSSVCFDYPSTTNSRETRTNEALANGAGEQMKAKYSYREIEQLLSECGFLIYEHLDYPEMTEQYFADYNRDHPSYPMAAPEGICYVHAVKE